MSLFIASAFILLISSSSLQAGGGPVEDSEERHFSIKSPSSLKAGGIPIISIEKDNDLKQAQAIHWLEMAAEQEDVSSQNHLIQIYLSRYRKDRSQDDITNTVKWCKRAIRHHSSEAQVEYARLYQNGWGVPTDHTKAVCWYRLAADQGNVDGQYSMGFAYENGWGGVGKDLREAISWYGKAARQGKEEAFDKIKALIE